MKIYWEKDIINSSVQILPWPGDNTTYYQHTRFIYYKRKTLFDPLNYFQYLDAAYERFKGNHYFICGKDEDGSLKIIALGKPLNLPNNMLTNNLYIKAERIATYDIHGSIVDDVLNFSTGCYEGKPQPFPDTTEIFQKFQQYYNHYNFLKSLPNFRTDNKQITDRANYIPNKQATGEDITQLQAALQQAVREKKLADLGI